MKLALADAEYTPIVQFASDEFDPGFQLENAPRNAIVVHNISAHADFGVPLNLQELLTCFNNAIYEPKEFNCVRIDVRVRSLFNAETRRPDSRGYPNIESVPIIDSGKISVVSSTISRRFGKVPHEYFKLYEKTDEYSTMKASVFSNGKVSITGAKSIAAVAIAVEKLCRAIRRRINKNARVISITPTNILAVYNFHSHIILQSLEKSCKGAIYDPFRFAGVRLRVPVPSSVTKYNVRLLILKALSKLTGKLETICANNDCDESSATDSDSLHTSSEGDGEMTPFAEPHEDPGMPHNMVDKTVVDISTKAAAASAGRSRTLKNHLHKFLSEVIPSNKRRVYHGNVTNATQPPVASKRLKDSSNNIDSRVWLNNRKPDGGEEAASKDEVVTVNVYTSGNITFTGARSIASIQHALSYVYPHLVANTANNVLQ